MEDGKIEKCAIKYFDNLNNTKWLVNHWVENMK